jgi:serine/threonine-protein kinase RsbT
MASLADLSRSALPVIERYTGKILAGAIRSSVWNALAAAGKSVADCSSEDFIAAALPGLRTYVHKDVLADCERELAAALVVWARPDPPRPTDPAPADTAEPGRLIAIESEADIVRARQEARKLCTQLAYGHTDTVRCCTVVSELARNIVQYAVRGTIELAKASLSHRGISIVATDKGPGISNLEAILDGRYVSRTGMGRGLLGTRAVLEQFEVTTRAGEGTTVRGVFRAR